MLNVDYSKYQSWEQVVTPSGGTYYKVPGTGYVYDPFLSQTKGRPVLFPNPQPEQEAQAAAEQAQADQLKLQKEKASPLAQLMPVAATVAAPIIANKIVDQFSDPVVKDVTGDGNIIFSNGMIKNSAGKIISTGAEATAPTTAGEAFSAGLSGVPQIPMAGNGAFSSLTPYGDVAASNGATAFSQGAGIAATEASPFSLSGIGSTGNVYLPAAGAIGAVDMLSHNYGPGRSTLEGAASGAAIGSTFGGGPGALVGAGIGAVVGLGKSLFFGKHKSIKQQEVERWQDLAGRGITDAQAAFNANHPPQDTGVWQSGPLAGKKWNFQDAQNLAKQDPSQFRLVYGNYDTFGNDWSKYNSKQQDAIVSALIGEGLYKSKKGDIIITDKARAHQIKDQVLSGTTPTAVNPNIAAKTQGNTTPLAAGANRLPTLNARV